jgi:hypothetical protein
MILELRNAGSSENLEHGKLTGFNSFQSGSKFKKEKDNFGAK